MSRIGCELQIQVAGCSKANRMGSVQGVRNSRKCGHDDDTRGPLSNGRGTLSLQFLAFSDTIRKHEDLSSSRVDDF